MKIPGNKIRLAHADTGWGRFLIAADEAGIVALAWPGRHAGLKALFSRNGVVEQKSTPVLTEASKELAAYISGRLKRFTVPLNPAGTGFQKMVWNALLSIPFGYTESYGGIARGNGRHGAGRAVGNACGANPVPVFIPCHRVVTSNGKIGGFSGGIKWKIRLLEHEGVYYS